MLTNLLTYGRLEFVCIKWQLLIFLPQSNNTSMESTLSLSEHATGPALTSPK